MGSIERLLIIEEVRLDREQLRVLVENMGPAAADDLVSQSMERLTELLQRTGKNYRNSNFAAMEPSLRAIIGLSRQVGMTLLARVAKDTLELCASNDVIALGATVARLERIGENSLVAMWNMQDLSV
ncbi:MAG: hypothetical protein CR993_04925 [Rhodobacterales bacterium]|nr:MAG: hypothetical protein CR993_04925 [Rhodobacterales bacterium]